MIIKLLIYLYYFVTFIYLIKTYSRQKHIFDKNEILFIIDISFTIYILFIFVIIINNK